MPQWLSCLPLREDTVEARVVHAQLVRMLEAGDPHLLGANNEHLSKVVKVFAVAMPTASLSEKLQLCTVETRDKMRGILSQMQSAMGDALGAAFASLAPEEQAALQQAMAGA